MARIKVTGYIDVEEIRDANPEYLDESHAMGLSNDGYEALNSEFSGQLDDVEFELVAE